MANNYTQFAELLVLKGQQERDWCKDQLTLGKEKYEWAMPEDEDEDDRFNAFAHDFTNDGLLLFADEIGDVEAVVQFVQTFLRKFQPDACFSISWADTCTRPRPGEFGGGAFLVTATAIEMISTSTWVQGKTKEFQKTLNA